MTRWKPRLRDPNEDRAPRGRHDGLLDTQCWCQHRLVPVDPEDIRAGITRSCGRAWCTPPRRRTP